MNRKSQLNINLTGLTFLSFVFAVVFMVGHTREILNMISAYLQLKQNSYLNLSNLAYCLVGILHMLLSAMLMYPHRDIEDKKMYIKLICYSSSLVYLLGNIWIFEWIFKSISRGGISYDVAQFLKVENMMFNHMQWVSRNAITIFYNHITAVVWFLIAYYFDRNRKYTWKLIVVQMLLCYLLPMIAYTLYKGKFIPDWWLKKTIPLICSDTILVLALVYVARSRSTWNKYVCPLITKPNSKKRKEALEKASRRHQHEHHQHSEVHTDAPASNFDNVTEKISTTEE